MSYERTEVTIPHEEIVEALELSDEETSERLVKLSIEIALDIFPAETDIGQESFYEIVKIRFWYGLSALTMDRAFAILLTQWSPLNVVEVKQRLDNLIREACQSQL